MKKLVKKLVKATKANGGRENFKKQALKYACRKGTCRAKKSLQGKKESPTLVKEVLLRLSQESKLDHWDTPFLWTPKVYRNEDGTYVIVLSYEFPTPTYWWVEVGKNLKVFKAVGDLTPTDDLVFVEKIKEKRYG